MPTLSKRDFVVRTQLDVANATNQATMSPNSFVLGSHTINTTAYNLGANVVLSMAALLVGNSTTNTVVNSTMIVLANSTSNTGLSVPTTGQVTGNYFLHANGSWVNPSVIPAVGSANRVYQRLVATSDQTVFTLTGGFDVVDVYYNGTHLANDEFTALSPNITLIDPADTGAVVELVGWLGTVIVLSGQGPNTAIQFNQGGNFSGSGNLSWDYVTQKLTVGTSTANVTSNSTMVRLANTTGSANVAANTIIVGNSTVYTTIGTTLTQTGSNTFNLGTSSVAANGYTYLPNGLLIQWGWVFSNNSVGNATFPVAFPTLCASIQINTVNATTAEVTKVAQSIAMPNTTVAQIRTSNATGSNVHWLAVGF